MNKVEHSILTFLAGAILFAGMISAITSPNAIKGLAILALALGLFLVLCPKSSYQKMKRDK